MVSALCRLRRDCVAELCLVYAFGGSSNVARAHAFGFGYETTGLNVCWNLMFYCQALRGVRGWQCMKLSVGFLFRVLLVILAALALYIAFWFVFLPSNISYYTQPGPSVNASVVLLVISVLYISISAWISFGDRRVRDWEKPILLISMLFGLLSALFLSFDASFQDMYPVIQMEYPMLYNNLAVTANYMLVIAAIMFLSILCFILIPRRKSIADWMRSTPEWTKNV